MKTGMEMLQDAYNVINDPNFRSTLSGGIYILERPKNSVNEDVVINGLPLTSDQLQQGVFNVNIHCPNLKNIYVGGEHDDTQPDWPRLTEISRIVVDKLTQFDGNDFHLSCANSGYAIKDTNLTWYINVRVNYYSFQNNYTNI